MIPGPILDQFVNILPGRVKERVSDAVQTSPRLGDAFTLSIGLVLADGIHPLRHGLAHRDHG
jgi:hypothetical protein